MNLRLLHIVVLTAVAAFVGAGATYLFISHSDYTLTADEVYQAMYDPELADAGPIKVDQDGTHIGGAKGEKAEFVLRLTASHDNGKPRVIKTVLANKNNYLAKNGYYVLYEWYRQDGSIERDKLVEPYTGMGCSVVTRYRLRFFDETASQTEERYIRPDGTLGALINRLNNHLCIYRADGVTPRYVQEYVGKDLRQVTFRKDGKTPWYAVETDGKYHIHFDLNGKPFNRVMESEAANGRNGFTMGSGDPPIEVRWDNFLRDDGTREYRQVWFHMWEKDAKSFSSFKDALGSIVLYDATGKNITAVYKLDIRPEGQPRFLKEVEFHNADGTKLVRRYRSHGSRLSEEVLDASGGLVSQKQFDESDRFEEKLDERLFHGFGHDVWGNPDDDSHDI